MLADCGLDLASAMHMPRIDVSGGSEVIADRRLASEVLARLRARFQVREAEHLVLPKLFACPTAAVRDPATGQATGMTDPTQPASGAVACLPS
jgi:gamma-glutamyltranspeptidase / glutathione hydrolase